MYTTNLLALHSASACARLPASITILLRYTCHLIHSNDKPTFKHHPKKHQPGKWRLITDLSFPEGASVDDAIDSSLCSLVYTSVEQVAEVALKLGPGSLLAKLISSLCTDLSESTLLIGTCLVWNGKETRMLMVRFHSVCALRQKSLIQWLML